MSHVQVSELRVRYAETDQMGVVYHANYLVWCEIGRTDFIREFGASYAELERLGFRLAVSDLSIRYHGAARYDDRIVVETRLADVRSRSVRFEYLIANADTSLRLASARIDLVSIDGSGRPVVLPVEFRERLLATR